MTAPGPLALYSDFNCPFCYAMHERLHAAGVMERVEWRGVQHAPQLPIPMARWNGRLMDELRHEVAIVGRLAPMLPINLPEGKPNTRPAIHLAARVLEKHAEQGKELVRRMYTLFWREGQDISDARVLGQLLTSLDLDSNGLLGTSEATSQLLAAWEHRWHGTGQAGVPLLERPDGTLLVGLARDPDLDRFLAGS